MTPKRFRLLALDVDGTLLDPEGALRPRTAAAVARAARAGIRPVLCTGRRYRRARPIAAQLGLSTPLVCNSGSIVKDVQDHRTLWRADLDPALSGAVLELFDSHDHPPLAFTDRSPDQPDFIVPSFPSGRLFFDDYVGQNFEHALVSPTWNDDLHPGRKQPPRDARFHLCAIGSRAEMLELEFTIRDHLDGRVRTFVQRSPRYLGTICEILRHDASKWTAILHLGVVNK
jgi:hydroxymethylpyrimidine pyrophosphatase-like HAD family hydrolase